MKAMKKIGRSGVELHEVKRNVSLDEDTPIMNSKPQSNYQPKKAKGGVDHPRAFFPGVGEFIPASKRKLVKLSLAETSALNIIFHKKFGEFDMKNKVLKEVCNKLKKKELIFWTTGHWATTWKGDAYFK